MWGVVTEGFHGMRALRRVCIAREPQPRQPTAVRLRAWPAFKEGGLERVPAYDSVEAVPLPAALYSAAPGALTNASGARFRWAQLACCRGSALVCVWT